MPEEDELESAARRFLNHITSPEGGKQRSTFYRALLRGEAPPVRSLNAPSLPPMLDDPEYIKRFQAAYRAALAELPRLVPGFAEEYLPISDELDRLRPGGSQFVRRVGEPTADFVIYPQYMNRPSDLGPYYPALKSSEPSSPHSITRKLTDWIRDLLEGATEGRGKRWDLVPAGTPGGMPANTDFPLNQRYPVSPGDYSGLSAILGRINPTELARNLASRVNAPVVGPWDLFPGGPSAWAEFILRHISPELFGEETTI